MATISVSGSRGGIGTSTFAWALARELRVEALLDLSSSQSLHWIIGKPETDFSWPTTLEETENAPLEKLIERSNKVSGISVISGGQPIKFKLNELSKSIVIDGNFNADICIAHITNSPQDFAHSKSGVSVMRQVPAGIPIGLLSGKFDYTYRSERSVFSSLNSGFGLHPKSKVQLLARQICEDVFRDFSVT